MLLLPGLFPTRGGRRSWLLGLPYGRFLVALMLVVGGEEMENKKEGNRGRENMGLRGGSPDSGRRTSF